MVKIFLSFFVFLLTNLHLHADPQNTKVSLKLDHVDFSTKSPITGVIDVQHDETEKIDVNNFVTEDKSFKATLIKTVKIDSINSPLVVSFYKFEIPAQNPGLYLFPAVEIKIGNKIFKTAPSSYQVKESVQNVIPQEDKITNANPNTIAPVLKLEAFVSSSANIYPGQQFNVGYKIYFNSNFNLDTVELPLLDAKGFKKLNKEQIKERREGGFLIKDIYADIEALNAGIYTFGPSYLIASMQNPFNKSQKSSSTRVEANDITITVLDFPKQNKPTSFLGSIGENLSFDINIQNISELYVGDKLPLTMSIQGAGDLSHITAPELCCQPGFPGYFEPDDLPSVPTNSPGKISFVTNITPLNDKITQIPAIEFSYFNPVEEKYYVLSSKPIPIKVLKSKIEKNVQKNESNTNKDFSWPSTSDQSAAIEIQTILPLAPSDLDNYRFSNWNILWIIPLAILVLFIQLELQKKRIQKITPQKKALDTLMEAELENSPSSFISLLQKSLILRLFETHHIPSPNYSINDLSDEGIQSEIKQFFRKIEKIYFTSNNQLDKKPFLDEAKRLFSKIETI